MMAALLRRHVVRWRSRQLYETFVFAPRNHFANGAFDQSHTCVHFLNQCRWSASSAQNLSGSFAAAAYSSSYCCIDLIAACSLNLVGGLIFSFCSIAGGPRLKVISGRRLYARRNRT